MEGKKEKQIIDGKSEMHKGTGLKTTSIQNFQNYWTAK